MILLLRTEDDDDDNTDEFEIKPVSFNVTFVKGPLYPNIC